MGTRFITPSIGEGLIWRCIIERCAEECTVDRRVGIRVRPDPKQSNLILLRVKRLIIELPRGICDIIGILVRLKYRSVGHVLDVFGCVARWIEVNSLPRS